MSFAGATPTSANTCLYRDQHKSLKRFAVQRCLPVVHGRVSVLLALVSFLTFVATSSPHHVHHFGDAAPAPQRRVHQHHEPHGQGHRQDHAAPADQSAPQPTERQAAQWPTCVVLLVLQSMPMLEAEQAFVSAPVASQQLEHLAPWCCLPEVDTNATRIRAPPSLLL